MMRPLPKSMVDTLPPRLLPWVLKRPLPKSEPEILLPRRPPIDLLPLREVNFFEVARVLALGNIVRPVTDLLPRRGLA